MTMALGRTDIARWRPFVAAVLLLAVAGCAQHRENDLRARLSKWFALGETQYFKSGMSCTAGEFAAASDTIRAALPRETQAERALFSLKSGGVMSLSLPDRSPDQWFISVMNADRPTGVAVQGAALGARGCMSDDLQALFRSTMITPGVVFVYDGKLDLLVLFDQVNRRILVGGGG